MSGKAIYRQRDVVLTKFPFSNLTDYKVRPALVLSKDSYNRKYADVIVCVITINLEEGELDKAINEYLMAIKFKPDDFTILEVFI